MFRDRCVLCERDPAVRCAEGAAPARRSPALQLACATLDQARLKIRPLEILQCMLCGDTNAQIAARLGVSVSTVKYYLRRLACPGAPRCRYVQAQPAFALQAANEDAPEPKR